VLLAILRMRKYNFTENLSRYLLLLIICNMLFGDKKALIVLILSRLKLIILKMVRFSMAIIKV